MTKRLYVGNLSYSTTEDSLKALFGQYGSVQSTSIVTDRMTGRSRGFGFVEMEDAGAQKAIDTLNGTDFEDRKIIVNEARPREERSEGGRGGGFRSRDRY